MGKFQSFQRIDAKVLSGTPSIMHVDCCIISRLQKRILLQLILIVGVEITMTIGMEISVHDTKKIWDKTFVSYSKEIIDVVQYVDFTYAGHVPW